MGGLAGGEAGEGIMKNNNFHEINCLEAMDWLCYCLQFKPIHIVL